MSFRIEQRVGKYTYLYEVTSYWDKEKKQPRQHRVLIGKRDPKTGELVDVTAPKRLSREYGPVYFLWYLLEQLGIEAVVRSAFPEEAREILLTACFQVAEQRPLYLCNAWLEHIYLAQPCRLPSAALSRLLKSIGENERAVNEFLGTWAGREAHDQFIVFDITSISSYAHGIDFVEWGYNRDRERLAQINLGVVYGEPRSIPLFYGLYPGSLPDVKTLANLLKRLHQFKVERTMFVLDKGFYSRANVEALAAAEMHFVIPVPITNKAVSELLKQRREELGRPESAVRFGKQLLYCIEDELRIGEYSYRAFCYLNEQASLGERERIVSLVLDIEEFVGNAGRSTATALARDLDERYPEWQQFFHLEQHEGRLEVRRNKAAIGRRLERAGLMVLITNDKLTATEGLSLYRKKDGVEKLFDAMKHGIDRRRLRIHSRTALQGLLFLDFLSLVLYSSIQARSKTSGLAKRYTVQEVFYELKKLNVIEIGAKAPMVTEVTKRQREIFEAFEMPEPTQA